MSGRAQERVTVSRAEPPLANFYQQREPWLKDAACTGSNPDVFFDHIDYANTPAEWKDAITAARRICGVCPVRKECFEATMREEGSAGDSYRAGFRAYTTAAQRTSLKRRGPLHGRDPKRLVLGWDGNRKVPPVPLQGDKWSRHHTTLARKVVRWATDNVEIGDVLPYKRDLLVQFCCKPDALNRVLDALVQDGTLDQFRDDARVRRYRRRSANRVIASWLPPHLRHNT